MKSTADEQLEAADQLIGTRDMTVLGDQPDTATAHCMVCPHQNKVDGTTIAADPFWCPMGGMCVGS